VREEGPGSARCRSGRPRSSRRRSTRRSCRRLRPPWHCRELPRLEGSDGGSGIRRPRDASPPHLTPPPLLTAGEGRA
jgi:hypothetical protein